MAEPIKAWGDAKTPVMDRMTAADHVWQKTSPKNQLVYERMDEEALMTILTINHMGVPEGPTPPMPYEHMPTCFLTANTAEILQYKKDHIACEVQLMRQQSYGTIFLNKNTRPTMTSILSEW
jgi:hypothetical protein